MELRDLKASYINLEEELYNKYIEKTSKVKNQKYAIILSKIKTIINMLKNGIEDNGIKRPADLLDYYLNVNTKVSLEDMLRLSKEKISPSDYALLKKFVTQNIRGTKTNFNEINEIMKEKTEINHEKDSKGNPILGTGEIFGNDKKQKIINFLKENEIPLNRKTYTLAFKRYLKGFLDLDVTKRKK